LYWQNGASSLLDSDDPDLKFVNATWFTFYEDYILPSVADRINYNAVVESVEYSDSEVSVQTTTGSFTADKVIVSVPLKILQNRSINFIPSLPTDKLEAIDSLTVWDGFKAFFEFTDGFYETFTAFELSPETDGQKLYYDASFGQNTDKNILGLFTVGKPALEYGSMNSQQFRESVLSELDEIYGNQATPNYIKHMTQYWNDEPFINGGYITDHSNWRTVRSLRRPVDNKIFFAGGPFTDGEDWVAVHAATLSAKDAVREVLS
jgi:monoamine oxidase